MTIIFQDLLKFNEIVDNIEIVYEIDDNIIVTVRATIKHQ